MHEICVEGCGSEKDLMSQYKSPKDTSCIIQTVQHVLTPTPHIEITLYCCVVTGQLIFCHCLGNIL